MKHIPNLFTLLNLIFGCIAVLLILQTTESIVSIDDSGSTHLVLPERIWQGSLFIFAAAVIDFLDGFLARLFGASSEMGKQLDSLSDVVSFGVAPGMILYQLLRMGFAQMENGLDVSVLYLLPAFIFPSAVAWRLAKFNISTNQVYGFRGIPSPAAGLLVASFPLILNMTNSSINYDQLASIRVLFINSWFLYTVILLVSYLMVSNHPFMAMKFTNYSFRNNALKYILLVISIISIILFKWLSIPLIFILYIIFSFFAKENDKNQNNEKSGTIDLTV